ncbi:pentatricopeptide repeat-containing protein At2g20710, mitochondrial-like isoform X2 [Abrus precatorius]|uniref:Pentatricopeptide repeat-containing protein At2g20710, mitochondrial-like isoform X2 n=1 Tax=Abrus precatorius TaxID=3816 RepID=A0A8B8KIJ9_ABRPR|nr:pentatricopeptide repeat-containing protein At2g20710, mitochondrial-like isoform X2 [Abrus precatorius]
MYHHSPLSFSSLHPCASEWMSNERNYEMTPGDIAKRISLISKVRGLEQAESFVKGVPVAKIGFKVYAALLKCYADHKSLEEAEAVMKIVKELHPMHLVGCYNLMLKLYAQMGKYDKLDRLMQEMKAKDICNAPTFTIRLNAYVAAADIKGMEKLLMQMEADPVATVDWCTYTTAANGYLKIHNFEKVTAMLKKSEHLSRGKTVRQACESLLCMYAAIGNKDEVYRLWSRMKSFKYSYNSSYLSVLSSLVKLDDIDGAEKILDEWESKHTHYDARIPNLMINVYCKCGQLDKAEAYIRRLLDSGKKLDGRAWDCLASGYRTDNDMEKAVQTMKKAVLSNRPRWRPNPFTLVACIEYQKGKGDLELALEILDLCKENGHISVTSYDRLVSYIRSEMPDTKPLDLIKEDYQMDGNPQLVREKWFNVIDG